MAWKGRWMRTCRIPTRTFPRKIGRGLKLHQPSSGQCMAQSESSTQPEPMDAEEDEQEDDQQEEASPSQGEAEGSGSPTHRKSTKRSGDEMDVDDQDLSDDEKAKRAKIIDGVEIMLNYPQCAFCGDHTGLDCTKLEDLQILESSGKLKLGKHPQTVPAKIGGVEEVASPRRPDPDPGLVPKACPVIQPIANEQLDGSSTR